MPASAKVMSKIMSRTYFGDRSRDWGHRAPDRRAKRAGAKCGAGGERRSRRVDPGKQIMGTGRLENLPYADRGEQVCHPRSPESFDYCFESPHQELAMLRQPVERFEDKSVAAEHGGG